jgi:hypothetical protein
MLTFFRKLRRNLFAKNKFSSYLAYAIGEITLIVIGILIALQINNWNTDRINKRQELKTYKNIRNQLVEDQKELTKVIGFNNYFIGQFEKANQYILDNNRNAIDTLAYIAMNLAQFSDFHRSANIYETLVNSGDLKLLKNDSITDWLQKIEMTYVFINRLEDIHWELIITEVSPEFRGVLNYTTFEIIEPDKLYAVGLQNIFFECINLMKIKDAVYNQATGELENIIGMINKELADQDQSEKNDETKEEDIPAQ